MITKVQNIILQHIFSHGDITYLEAFELLGLRDYEFLDSASNLVYQRILSTTQIEMKNKNGRPLIVNRYSLTSLGKRLCDTKFIQPKTK